MIVEIGQPQTVLKLSGNGRLVTPSDWFASKYRAEAEMFGPPILENHRIDMQGELQVTPIQINEDFFAAVVGGSGRVSKVIFYEPEHLFYQFDAVLGYYTQTSEEKIKLCLSQDFIKCASFFSQRLGTVDVRPIFLEFRSEETLNAVVQRAKALLAKDASFFAEGTGNAKDPSRLTGEQTAKIFVREAVESNPGSVLKLGEAYDKYWYFCETKNLPTIERRKFREPSATEIKAKFGKGIRSDLKLDGKWIDGWKDLDIRDLVTG